MDTAFSHKHANRVRGLVRRGQVYYFRRRVPSDLVKIVGHWVIVRSLRTQAWAVALQALAQCDQAIESLFVLTRKATKLDAGTAKRIFHGLLEQWMGGEDFSLMPSSAADIALTEERLKDKSKDLRDIGADFLMGHDELRNFVSFSDIRTVEQIGSMLLRTSLEHARQLQAIQSGRWEAKAFDPYFDEVLASFANKALPQVDQDPPRDTEASSAQISVPVSNEQPDAAQNPPCYSLEQVYTAYRKENEQLWDFKRWYKFDYAFRILVHVFGRYQAMGKITQPEVRHVKNVLVQMPSNASKRPQLVGKSIDKQIEIAKKQDLALLSHATINTHLSHMRLIFKWAMENGFVTNNPFDGMKVKAPKTKKSKRKSFDPNQLKAIFSTPTYTGLKSQHKWREQGHVIHRDMRYWVPLIAVHTGMRQAEICQLNLCDVTPVSTFFACLQAANSLIP